MANLNFDFDDVPEQPEAEANSKSVRALPVRGPWATPDKDFVNTICGEPWDSPRYDPAEDLKELARNNATVAYVCKSLSRASNLGVSSEQILAAGIKCIAEQNDALIRELMLVHDNRPIIIRSSDREWTFDPNLQPSSLILLSPLRLATIEEAAG